MKKETMQTYIESYTGNDLAADLVQMIEKSNDVRQERARINRKRRAFENEKRAREKDLGRLERALQNSCLHLECTFHADPTSSNSYYKCDLCGKTL